MQESCDNDEKYLPEQLRHDALEIIQDLDSTDPPSDIPPSHKLAFYVYPRARAHEYVLVYRS